MNIAVDWFSHRKFTPKNFDSRKMTTLQFCNPLNIKQIKMQPQT